MIYCDENNQAVTIEAYACPVCGSTDIYVEKAWPGSVVGNGWEDEEVWEFNCRNCRMVQLSLPANDFMIDRKYYETVPEAVMEWNSLCEKYTKQREAK